MRKRLLAMLIALVMVASLLPVAALAAGNTVQSSNGYVSVSYENDGALKRSITVNIYGSDGTLVDTAEIDDAIYRVQSVTITLNSKYASQFDIESVDVSGGSDTSMSISADTCSFDLAAIDGDDGATVSVYLCEEYVAPALPDGLIDNSSLTRSYRIYDDQILKLLHDAGVSVSETTEIKSVQPAWVKSFAEDYRGFDRIDREEDYWHLTVTSSNANVETVQPNNIRKITITYDNGNGEQSVNVYSDDLRYHIDSEASSRYYRIELNDDSFHIVYFYNEPGSQAGNNYFLYAVRFVEHGASLGSDMPPQPDYGTGNTYMFVNWELGSYDGTGDPFLSTTVVNEDLTVFAKKVSSPDDGGTEIWVMNYEDDQLLKRIAELYNETSSPSIDVADIDLDSVKISVYDNSKSTNQDYYNNGWRNDEEYYYVCNYNVPAGLPTLTNNHVAFNDIQGITVFFSLVNSGIVQEVRIPVGENPGDIAKSHSAVDNIIELRIIQPSGGPGGDDDKVVYTVNYYYDGVPDASKTVTSTGTVGDTITITTVPDKSGTGYCLDRSNLPFELTAYEEQNVITVYYATDANDDDIPDSKQVFIKYVSSDAELGTVSPDMQVETFADGESSDIVLSGTATAKSGAEFVNWKDENDFPVSDKKTIDYTLKSPDLGKTYTFTANFKTIPVETVTLTYDANGGENAPAKEESLEKEKWHTMSTQVPNHQNVNNVKVVFGGWSLDYAVIGKVYDKDGEPTGICLNNQVYMSMDMTVYAVWGLDKNGNGTADFNEQQFTVTYTDGAGGKVFTDQVYSGLLAGEDTPNYVGTLTHPDGLSFTGWDPKVSAKVTGNATYTATWTTPASPEKPASPTEDELKALFDGKVNVQCVNSEAAHAAKSYGYETAGFTVGEVMDAGTSYTVKVTIDAAHYQAKYNTDIAAKHNLASGQSTKVTVELRYDNGWKLNEAAPTIKVVCDTPAAPNAPAEDELRALFDGKVFVDCVEKSWHPTYVYGLLANGYTVAGPVKGEDGEYTCTVTLLASAYLAEYNGDVAEKHALASYQGDEAVALKWTGSAWTVINGELPVTFDVVCDTWYPPIIPPVTPSEPDYTPNWLNTTDHVSYIIGYEDGTVKPNAGITRAEVATIFFRLLTDGARERFWSESNAYSDVAAGSWYNIAVSTLSNMGILGGYEDGSFRPNASITRAEFAKIAVSFFDWADVYAVNSFVDVRDSAWYANYVAVAAEIGLIEGYGGNVFRPDATITRAEACTIINRTLGRAPDADHLLPVAQMNTWPDNSDTGVWYYAQIQEATNSHDYRWIGSVEQWTAKLADPDWDKLQY